MRDLTIVWFRLDLRLADNLALLNAVNSSKAVLPVYIWNHEEETPWAPGAASRWWLQHSLKELDDAFRACGSRLVLREGKCIEVLRKLAKESGASAVFCNHRYDPSGCAQEKLLSEALRKDGIALEVFNSSLLHDPRKIMNKEGKPFKVFTPFWKHLLNKLAMETPVSRPKAIPFPEREIHSESLDSFKLLPEKDWAGGMRNFWKPGEVHAQLRLKAFIEDGLEDYAEGRDRPDFDKVSMLSPHLHFGEIGPRQIHHTITKLAAHSGELRGADSYLRELGWREFAHYILFHFPDTSEQPLRPEFKKFPWSANEDQLRKWQTGQTGYPIVDAGMRQLWHTGWMHNRVRMIVASFLTKDLLISWNDGAAWFWDTLVDADLANNTLGWQWAGGCGADAAPYFRIFNPELQSEKFDPEGTYVKQWLPELSQLPAKWIYSPSKAPADVLQKANVEIGKTYPAPMVDHSLARKRALAALAEIKQRL